MGRAEAPKDAGTGPLTAPPQECRGEGGMTLLEVLVALTVFSLAVLAHLSLQTENVRAVGAIEEKILAQIVADNVLAEALGTAEPLRPGRLRGEMALADRTWVWTRQVRPTDNQVMWRVDVAVRSADAGDGRESAFLSGFRRIR
ncbi:MAG: type II secretion system minor pseudopilin GspI [Alphaproteobacteria bacterium]